MLSHLFILVLRAWCRGGEWHLVWSLFVYYIFKLGRSMHVFFCFIIGLGSWLRSRRPTWDSCLGSLITRVSSVCLWLCALYPVCRKPIYRNGGQFFCQHVPIRTATFIYLTFYQLFLCNINCLLSVRLIWNKKQFKQKCPNIILIIVNVHYSTHSSVALVGKIYLVG